MPDAGSKIDPAGERRAGEIARGVFGNGTRAENDGLVESPVVLEQENHQAAFKNDERFGFGRRFVAVGRDIGALHKDVQETVRIVLRPGVKIVVHPQARGLLRFFDDGLNQRVGQQLGGGSLHVFISIY